MPALMGTMTVVSPNTQEAKGVRDPKGTGPYLFNTWTPGQSVTLKGLTDIGEINQRLRMQHMSGEMSLR